MKSKMMSILLVLTFVLSPLYAQEVTLSRGIPAEAGMSEAVLKEGVRL